MSQRIIDRDRVCKAGLWVLAFSMAVLGGLMAAPRIAHGSDFVSRQVIRQRIVTVVPPVQYFVGAPIRERAVARYELRSDPDWAEFQQFKAWKASQGEAPPVEELAEPPSLIAAMCVKCHGGEDPKGGLDLSLPLTEALVAKAAGRIWRGEMPPPKFHQLTAEEKKALFDELFPTPHTEE